jgi:hypothetical protein
MLMLNSSKNLLNSIIVLSESTDASSTVSTNGKSDDNEAKMAI